MCTLMIIYVLFYKPVYVSTKIMSMNNGGTLSQAAGLAAQFGITMPATQSEPNGFILKLFKAAPC